MRFLLRRALPHLLLCIAAALVVLIVLLAHGALLASLGMPLLAMVLGPIGSPFGLGVITGYDQQGNPIVTQFGPGSTLPTDWVSCWDFYQQTDQANHFIMIQRAMAAGLAAFPRGFVLWFPANAYTVNIPMDGTGCRIPSGAAVTIKGDGVGASIVTATNGPLTGQTFLFTVAAGGSLSIEDMTFVGPSNSNGQTSEIVQHLGTSGNLSIRRVSTTGFVQPFQTNDGASVTFFMTGCNVQSNGAVPQNAMVFCGDILSARIYDSDFRNWGPGASNIAHALYIHQGVDLEVSRCSFDQNNGNGYCVHQFNGSGTSPNSAVTDCWFGPTSYRGVLSNPTVRTRIADCRFLCNFSGVTLQFDADVADCQFSGWATNNAGSSYAITQIGSGTPANLNVRDSFFNSPSPSTYAIFGVLSGNIYRIVSCTFTCNQATTILNNAGSNSMMLACAYADDGVAHLLTPSTTTPTLSALNGNVVNASVVGNDVRGVITFDVITASISAGTVLFQVNFTQTYGAVPVIMMTNEDGSRVNVGPNVGNRGTSSFTVRPNGTLGVTTLIQFAYLVVG